MKKVILLVLFVVLAAMDACKNFEIEHPDYIYSSCYFATQYPVRTIILGDYIYDNSMDNDHKCSILATMAGVYENKKDRKLTFEVDNSLCKDFYFNTKKMMVPDPDYPDDRSKDKEVTVAGDPVTAMPASYYSLSHSSEMVIPKGKLIGGVEVQLTDAFFNDPLAVKNTYVIPLRLKSTNDLDSILSGKPAENLGRLPDPRVPRDWITLPKNYIMYAIKYINEYDAVYIHYGKSSIKKGQTVLKDSIYKTRYIEANNSFVKLATTGRKTVASKEISIKSPVNKVLMPGEITLQFEFDNSQNCKVTGSGTYKRGAFTTIYKVNGTGKFVSKDDDEYNMWGNKKRDVIKDVKFTVVVDSTDDPQIDPDLVYSAEDTFVVQNRNVVFETYSPTIF